MRIVEVNGVAHSLRAPSYLVDDVDEGRWRLSSCADVWHDTRNDVTLAWDEEDGTYYQLGGTRRVSRGYPTCIRCITEVYL